MLYTIYHNPRCKKSRAGLAYLESKGVEYEVVEYLKKEISRVDLKRILMKLNQPASYIARTQEDMFKKELKGKKFTEEEWITIYLQNPKLIQRPIVEAQYKAVIADPPETINCLLNN